VPWAFGSWDLVLGIISCVSPRCLLADDGLDPRIGAKESGLCPVCKVKILENLARATPRKILSAPAICLASNPRRSAWFIQRPTTPENSWGVEKASRALPLIFAATFHTVCTTRRHRSGPRLGERIAGTQWGRSRPVLRDHPHIETEAFVQDRLLLESARDQNRARPRPASAANVSPVSVVLPAHSRGDRQPWLPSRD